MAFNQHLALSIFKTVAQKESFSRAAVELGLSASAVSQAVRQLEAELGVRLFHRTTRSVSLTEAGTLLWAQITPLLSDMAEVLENVKASPQSLKGVLKLSMPYVVWQGLICPMLPAFAQAYPEIELSVDIADGLVDIAGNGFDAGIRLEQKLHQNMVAVPLGIDFEAQLVASPAYLSRYGVPTVPQTLAQHRCIGYRFHSQGTVYAWQLTSSALNNDQDQTFVFQPSSLLVNEERALIEAAKAGLGITEVFTVGVVDELHSGALVSVLPGWRSPSQRFCLYYPNRQYLSSRLQAFIVMLKQHVAGR
ncbi:MAG: LysR family transcriptional regulator [Neisseriaceae bacterium]|nr:LysR family transcriptional regulator [Neisseriaceae bacterium]